MVGKKAENKAVGRTKGGLNTKIHAIVDGLGNPVAFLLSPGNDNDSIHAIELMNMTDIAGSNLLGDKAYGTKEILAIYRRTRSYCSYSTQKQFEESVGRRLLPVQRAPSR